MQLEMTLGSLNIFLSPRQLHVITMFSDLFIFSDGDCSNPSNQTESIRQRHHIDPSPPFINEDELIGNLSGGLGSNQGWSTEQYRKLIISGDIIYLSLYSTYNLEERIID